MTDTDIPNIIVNSTGRLIELSAEKVAALSPERQDRYRQVRDAVNDRSIVANLLADDEKAERQAEKDLQVCTFHLSSLIPATTFLDALRAAQKSYRDTH